MPSRGPRIRNLINESCKSILEHDNSRNESALSRSKSDISMGRLGGVTHRNVLGHHPQ